MIDNTKALAAIEAKRRAHEERLKRRRVQAEQVWAALTEANPDGRFGNAS